MAKETAEAAYLLTGDREAGPATLDAWVCGQWKINTVFTESATSPTWKTGPWSGPGTRPRVMVSLGSLAISLLRLEGHANIVAANCHPPGPAADAQAAPGRLNTTLPNP